MPSCYVEEDNLYRIIRGLRVDFITIDEQGTRLFGLADSVTGLFGLGRSGLEKFRSGYEILQ